MPWRVASRRRSYGGGSGTGRVLPRSTRTCRECDNRARRGGRFGADLDPPAGYPRGTRGVLPPGAARKYCAGQDVGWPSSAAARSGQ